MLTMARVSQTLVLFQTLKRATAVCSASRLQLMTNRNFRSQKRRDMVAGHMPPRLVNQIKRVVVMGWIYASAWRSGATSAVINEVVVAQPAAVDADGKISTWLPGSGYLRSIGAPTIAATGTLTSIL